MYALFCHRSLSFCYHPSLTFDLNLAYCFREKDVRKKEQEEERHHREEQLKQTRLLYEQQARQIDLLQSMVGQQSEQSKVLVDALTRVLREK